jgi:hypothetical protein
VNRRSGRALLAVLAGTAPLVAGCRSDSVRIGFRPEPGNRYVYRITVHAETVTTLGGQPERRAEADDVLEAHHAVLATGRDGSSVRVRLRQEGAADVTFVVRLDRAARLARVEQVEGLPSPALGELGLSEIFPPAAGAPPDRPLAPGESWGIDEPVTVGTAEAARLTGRGRLTELGVVDGRDVARVEATYRLPVRRTTGASSGRVLLDGAQDTTTKGTYAIEDGAVVSATATTRGSYRLTLFPPEGTAGAPLTGTLVVELRSRTSRVG